jgi:hypothetical protein
MKFNSKNIKAIAVYFVLSNIALFLSGFGVLVWQDNKQFDQTYSTEKNVISGMGFIGYQPSVKLVCNYFSGITILKKIFVHKNNSLLKEKKCPFINRL